MSVKAITADFRRIQMSDDYYALYKGDKLLAHGTLEEIHQQTGKKMASLKWLTYPVAKRRHKKRQSKNAQELIKVE
jgi:hypothetical protein